MSNTTNKYMMVLQYICGQQSFHSRETLQKFKVTNNLLTAGKDMGLFKRVGKSEYAWNLNRPPLMSDVHGLMVRIRSYNKTTELKPKRPGQLKLQPIKRIERVATMPVRVQEEPIHDTSNSKVIIILAVGAMVGFLIATIIWK
jgi:hypothetical protein